MASLILPGLLTYGCGEHTLSLTSQNFKRGFSLDDAVDRCYNHHGVVSRAVERLTIAPPAWMPMASTRDRVLKVKELLCFLTPASLH